MMRNNTLLNIQKNKITYNKYFQEFSTQKKIQKPSDDPTIAVRSLKYRTTLIEIEQYLTNCDDAQNWMDATEEPMNNVNGILDTMIEYVTNAATGTNNTDDRGTIADQLKQYTEYIYEQNANTDYAGRYLFTGFRTDVPLLFSESQNNVTYNINETLEINDMQRMDYVYGEPVRSDTKTAEDYATEHSLFQTTNRLMISYKDCDAQDITITYKDKDGNENTITAVTKSIADAKANGDPYNSQYNPGAGEVFFVPETGELLFGDDIYDTIRGSIEGAVSMDVDKPHLSVNYTKTDFKTNDIRPEHYFECSAYDKDTGLTKNYTNTSDQNIQYQINFSQVLTVNTLGKDAFDTSIMRAVDDVFKVSDEMSVMEEKLKSYQKRLNDCDPNDKDLVNSLKELCAQTETEISLQNTVITKTYSKCITVFQDAKGTLNEAVAKHGAKYNRLKMTINKLDTLQVNTKEAKSENEDADLEEAYVNYSEAELLYQAALQATSKILGTSLLDYI
ncbi:MAG: flagellar hook-associated protein FlgL [Eubacterium sp.]|nr:flagellar hook-associated protein FlgL [Eubacterium sp.]